MRVVRLTTTEFFNLRSAWNTLLAASNADSVFLSWEWQYHWWQHIGQRLGELYVLAVFDEPGTLVGVAPWYCARERHGLFWYATLRFLSDAEYIARKLDILCSPGFKTEVLQALWEYLMKQPDWELGNFLGVPKNSGLVPFLEERSGERKILVRRREEPYSLVDLSNWDKYLATLKPRMRTKVRALLKQFDDFESRHEVSWSLTTRSETLPADLASFRELHQARWNRAGQVGLFASAGMGAFIGGVMPALLENGWLFFVHLYYRGQPVAHQFCLRYTTVVYLINEGYDVALPEIEPGNMLRAVVFRDLSRQGLTYDFLNHYSPHKAAWGAVKYKQLTLVIGLPRLKNRWYFASRTAWSVFKKTVFGFSPPLVRLVQQIRLTAAQRLKFWRFKLWRKQ